MSIREIMLTPELAKAFLEGNDRNRPCSQVHVNRLAKEMLAGRWKFNGDTICRNGSRLIDGQHRCEAVVKSGVSVRTILVEGLDHDVFDTKDCGKKRSAGDVLAVSGEKHYTTVAAALKVVDSYMTGQFDKEAGKQRWSNSEVTEILAKYPEVRESVQWCRSLGNKGLLQYSVMCGLHYLFSRGDTEKANDFFTLLIGGAGLESGNAIFVLRERLVANMATKAKLPQTYTVAITIKAWNHWREGTPIKYLRWRTEGKPEPFPLVKA
jgi:hypothetical protein